jgi:hypothetical protein
MTRLRYYFLLNCAEEQLVNIWRGLRNLLSNIWGLLSVSKGGNGGRYGAYLVDQGRTCHQKEMRSCYSNKHLDMDMADLVQLQSFQHRRYERDP